MTEAEKDTRLLTDAGIGRQLREHIRKDPNLHDWSGEIASHDDLEALNVIHIFYDSWLARGLIESDISAHPVLGKVIRSIRSRNVNESIQKKTTELGMLTSLMGAEDYGISARGLAPDSLPQFILEELDNPYCSIWIRGKPGSGKTDLALLLMQFYKARRKVWVASNMKSFENQDGYVRCLEELEEFLDVHVPDIILVLLDESSSWYNSRNFSKKDNLEFGVVLRTIRKRKGKLILIGHRKTDIDIDYRELCTLEIEKPSHRNPKRAIFYIDDRKIDIKDIPATLLIYDTYDMGDFNIKS